jgi:hypothetical protein
MKRTRRVVLAIASALVAASCGSSNKGAGPDASGDGDGNPGGGDAANPDSNLPSGVVAIPLSSPDGSFYTANMMIGAQSFAMVVDTGSTSAAVAGSACTGCGVTPSYKPGTTAADQHQAASAQYGSGSWKGEIYSDMLGLGFGTPSVAVKFASITSQVTFFDGNQNTFQGLLGLGGDGLLTQGTTSFLDAVVAAGVKDIESFQMCDSAGGTMWMGGYDASHTGAAPQYTAMNTQLPYYAVTLSDMKLGTTSIGYTSSSAVADTGTSLFYVPQAVANNVVTQANKQTTLWQSNFTADSQGIYCTMAKSGVTATQIDAAMPPLTLTFPGSGGSFTMSAPATHSYMLDASGGMWCIGIAYNSQLFGITLMGDVGLRGFVTVFDRVNQQVGFAPSKGCPASFRAKTEPTWVRERGHIPSF